ncbi:MAG: hydroxymethylglutaryl-CoA lyase [Acidobacteriota bacterium]
MTRLPTRVSIVEVGPRDGLQNEPAVLSTAQKVAFVNRLTEAGHSRIEVAAFVSPKWVPQMGDAADVFEGITRRPGVRYSALVPNRTGLDRALAAKVEELAVFAAASETFSQRNVNQTVHASMSEYRELTSAALAAGAKVRAYLSTSFGCPFEGPVDPGVVVDLTERLLEMGAYEVAVSDTIGVAHPGQVARLLVRLLARFDASSLALHFHDTRGTALANVLTALEHGITAFDSSAGGLGGCPYAPGATGNLATEDLLYMLDGLGIQTGIAVEAVLQASTALEPSLGHPVPSRFVQAFRGAQRAAQSNDRS